MQYRDEKLKTVSFPLGGIGTGCIGISGNGELVDWEIFNRPNKNTRNGYSHFAIRARKKGGKWTARVLHGDILESAMGSYHSTSFGAFGSGPRSDAMPGAPHFRQVTLDATFPIARFTFEEEEFPAVARLLAFNPLIPHDDFHSSLPVAFLEWEIENTQREEMEYSLAFTVRNPAEEPKNEALREEGRCGIFFSRRDRESSGIGDCDLAVFTDAPDAEAQTHWSQDGVITFWRQLCNDERLGERVQAEGRKANHGTVAVHTSVPAGERKKIRFVLAWNTPVQYNYWRPCRDAAGRDVTWKNRYATVFRDSRESARYALSHFDALKEKTEAFTSAMGGSSLPPFVVDAITANLSVMKSPTLLRLEDGSLWGWEGCFETEGSCEGSCQHVWNYAYALPFLFPNLERSFRENFVKYGLLESGQCYNRISLPLDLAEKIPYSCLDGQMGEVIKWYREWKISGDTEWLKRHSRAVLGMLEYAWSEANESKWDQNRDGVLEGRQFHTLDAEIIGPTPWLEGMYLLALACGAEMAEALGEEERAKDYRALYEKGRAWTNEHLFNGEFFAQSIDLSDRSLPEALGLEGYWDDETEEIRNQIGDGCHIDQMLADWHAALIGKDFVFDPDKAKTALSSLYRYNFHASMREVTNFWRSFALNDEGGTVICSYPEGTRRPAHAIPYAEETMTGFEYAFGGLLIARGMVKEGEQVVRAVRGRHDGERRNPWNEFECGSNYARSMASYALLLLYSGFVYDMARGRIGFRPIQEGDGSYFWSVKNSWGRVVFRGSTQSFEVLGEEFTLSEFVLPRERQVRSVTVDGASVPFRREGGVLLFDGGIAVKQALVIE